MSKPIPGEEACSGPAKRYLPDYDTSDLIHEAAFPDRPRPPRGEESLAVLKVVIDTGKTALEKVRRPQLDMHDTATELAKLVSSVLKAKSPDYNPEKDSSVSSLGMRYVKHPDIGEERYDQKSSDVNVPVEYARVEQAHPVIRGVLQTNYHVMWESDRGWYVGRSLIGGGGERQSEGRIEEMPVREAIDVLQELQTLNNPPVDNPNGN